VAEWGRDISHRCLPLHYSFNLVPSVFPSVTNSLLVANTNYVCVCVCVFFIVSFPLALRPNSDHGLVILEAFLDQTQRRNTVGRTPLDEWSAYRRHLYLTTHNTHNRQTSMPPGAIRTHDLSRRAAADLALDNAATGTGYHNFTFYKYLHLYFSAMP
jgi:hypothetical protein